MGCCGDSTEVEPIKINGRPLSGPQEEFSGLVKEKDRGCRDVLCLLIFIAFCIGGIIYIIVAYTQSDPARLIHGYDAQGNVCGQDNEAIDGVSGSGQDKSNSPFFDIPRGVCKGSCDSTQLKIGYKCFPGNRTESEAIKDQIGIFVTDVRNSWRELLAICLIGLALSIIVVLLLRFLAGIIVWITVVVIALGSIAGTVALWIVWHQNRDSQNGTYLLIAAIITTIFTVLLLVMLVAMRNRIRLVIQLFTEAGKAVSAMPLLLLQPIWTLLAMIIVVGVWCASWIPIQSSGTFVEDGNDARLDMDNVVSGMRVYHIFGFLWVTQFVIACHILTVAGAVVMWYFTRNKKKLDWPIMTSMGNVVKYHLGSLAFGSVIIAIVKLVRLILKYIEKKLGGENSTLSCLLKCCQCCLWCFERFLKYLTTNAYIEIAIYGLSFCEGAKKAFGVITNNALRVSTLNFVGDFVLLLMQLVVVASTVVAGKFILDTNPDINSIFPSLIVGGVITYLVVYCFISVYGMTIDTLFICFCEDIEVNDGVEKPYFMSRGLMKFVENSQKAIEAHDQRVKDAKNNNNNIHSIQIPPNHQKMASPSAASRSLNVTHGKSGMTPLHPGYPPVSAPPSPSQLLK